MHTHESPTHTAARKRGSIIIDLPEGFPIPTNPGNHGDMQYFEFPNHSFTVFAPSYVKDEVTFLYQCRDSDEGEVFIIYNTQSGNDAKDDELDPDGWFDVSVRTGSDGWGLEETMTAVQEAIQLHKALGRDKLGRE